jgi:3-phosphoshikimate 1-carboxyvinyltransferase
MTIHLRVPGSKSMTQRALVIAALSQRPRAIRGALWCDDSEHLTEILRGLGTKIAWLDNQIDVEPPIPAQAVEASRQPAAVAAGAFQGRGQRFDCGNAGTAARFGAALALLTEGPFIIDGDARMRERPIGPLSNALAGLGVQVTYLEKGGGLPARFERISPASASVFIGGSDSSQFASGLMMVAPRLARGLAIDILGEMVSRTYLEMTAEMMRRCGAAISLRGAEVRVEAGSYASVDPIEVEPDWSSASFLLAGAWILDREAIVDDLLPRGTSLQGDAVFPRLLEELATHGGHRFDLRDAPDLIAPLAAAALFATAPTTISGVQHARTKESDRISALAGELRKLGAAIDEADDGLRIEPLPALPHHAVELDPHRDHRLAMLFGVLSLRIPQIEVLDPGCVTKSFPDFWGTLDRLRAPEGSF